MFSKSAVFHRWFRFSNKGPPPLPSFPEVMGFLRGKGPPSGGTVAPHFFLNPDFKTPFAAANLAPYFAKATKGKKATKARKAMKGELMDTEVGRRRGILTTDATDFTERERGPDA